MHPHLITGNPFVIFTSRHFSLSLCFPHRFFLFWQKYRPNMMCILLKVQHNLLPLVCLQSQQSPTAQRGLPTATALFRRSRLFPGARVGVGDKEGPTLEGVAFLSGHSANQTPHDAAEPPLSRWGSRGVVDTGSYPPKFYNYLWRTDLKLLGLLSQQRQRSSWVFMVSLLCHPAQRLIGATVKEPSPIADSSTNGNVCFKLQSTTMESH